MKIDRLGAIGIVTDIGESELPVNAVTAGENFRCKNGYITPHKGYIEYGAITGEAHYLLPQQTETNYNLIFPADLDSDGNCEKIYKFDGSALDNLTRQTAGVDVDYASDDPWNGCTLNGILLLNNGSDAPQVLTETAARCTDMIYSGTDTWGDVTYSASVIRAHKNFLFAIRINDNGTLYRTMVHWSSAALPGAAPTSWDYTDQTELSNRRVLAETDGEVIDGLPLRDDFLVYKEDSVFVFSYTDDPTYVYASRALFLDRGIYAQDCICDIGGRHFVVGDGRVYTHDGNSPEDILVGRNADAFFAGIDPVNYKATKVAHNRPANEVWILYPEIGASVCTKALIYNYLDTTWTTRGLPGIRHAIVGSIAEPAQISDTWDVESVLTWDSEVVLTWKEQVFSPIGDALIAAGGSIWHMDAGYTDDGTDTQVYAERTGLVFGELGDWVEVTDVYPRCSGSGSFQLQIGKQKTIGDRAVQWSVARTVTPGETKRLKYKVNGPVHAWKVTGAGSWQFYGMDIRVAPAGSRS